MTAGSGPADARSRDAALPAVGPVTGARIARELADRFPARPAVQAWAATRLSREQAQDRLLASRLLAQDLPTRPAAPGASA